MKLGSCGGRQKIDWNSWYCLLPIKLASRQTSSWFPKDDWNSWYWLSEEKLASHWILSSRTVVDCTMTLSKSAKWCSEFSCAFLLELKRQRGDWILDSPCCSLGRCPCLCDPANLRLSRHGWLQEKLALQRKVPMCP